MLNYDAKHHTILSILRAALIGTSIGLIVAEMNPDPIYQAQLEY